MKSTVRPYIMDLGSTNGTYLNSERLDSQRYYELLPKVTDCLPHSADSGVLQLMGQCFMSVARTVAVAVMTFREYLTSCSCKRSA